MTNSPSSDNDIHLRATSRSLPIALLRARERVMGPIRSMLVDAGVTEQQWRVLRVLDETGPSDATEIAKTACLLMPSLTRILQVLETKALCSRRAHPSDKRRTVVEITNSGRDLIARNIPTSNQIFAELESEFGTERLEQLLDLLNELVVASDKSAP